MKTKLTALAAGLALAGAATVAQADDIEGRIEAIDPTSQTFIVQGIVFHADERTDWDDGLRGFGDLQIGQKVEVDFDYRDGRHIAREVELED